jgi:Ca-activated chloride channel family protein
VAAIEVPLNRTSIILALDVSRSMCATDVDPNRLAVAQEAALAFIEGQPAGTQIGIVAFADLAQILVPPTTDKEPLREAIRTLTTSIGTAIGSATLKAIDAIAEINPDVLPSGLNMRIEGSPAEADGEPYVPDIIVVLTDGANTRGPHPLDAARQAADRRVRVFTIGFGTTTPRAMVCSPAQMGVEVGGGGFGGGGGGGFRRFLLLDERTLQGVADLTGGTYYRAESAEQLLEVFSSLPAQITLQKQDVELSAGFSALGALLFTSALALSLLWTRLA